MLQQTLDLSRCSCKICTLYGGQFCRLPDVVNIYCLIVFPAAKDFLFLTLFISDLKPTAKSELFYNWSLLVSSPRFKSMCKYCFLLFIGHPLWRKSGPVLVWSHYLCWLCLCSQYKELNVIYTIQYIPELTNPWHAERFSWHVAFTDVPVFFILFAD
jgi:hypothetical protein